MPKTVSTPSSIRASTKIRAPEYFIALLYYADFSESMPDRYGGMEGQGCRLFPKAIAFINSIIPAN
jgi:hypothetical protein